MKLILRNNAVVVFGVLVACAVSAPAAHAQAAPSRFTVSDPNNRDLTCQVETNNSAARKSVWSPIADLRLGVRASCAGYDTFYPIHKRSTIYASWIVGSKGSNATHPAFDVSSQGWSAPSWEYKGAYGGSCTFNSTKPAVQHTVIVYPITYTVMSSQTPMRNFTFTTPTLIKTVMRSCF